VAARSAPASCDEVPFPDDAVEVGRVIGARGIGGAIKVAPLAADPQALFSAKRWFLKPPAEVDGAPRRRTESDLPPLVRIRTAREHAGSVVATVEGVTDRDAAQALRGARVFVSRGSFPTPAADEYYWVDLIGLAVVNRQGDALGSVVGLIETGPHCVLRVQSVAERARERLIPFVSAYVDAVDVRGGRIRVDWDLDDD
jgi:16S rRNA processing protein RimM